MIAYAPDTRFDSFKRAILELDPDAHIDQHATDDESGACFDTDMPAHILHANLSEQVGCFVEVYAE